MHKTVMGNSTIRSISFRVQNYTSIMEEVLPSAPPMMAELFGLTVRTLSGTEYKLANVQMHYTVADLKEMICDVAPNFPVKQQKLIKGSSTLVDTATMGEVSEWIIF